MGNKKRARLSRCFCVLASVAVLRTAVEAKTKMEGKAFSLMSLFNKKKALQLKCLLV